MTIAGILFDKDGTLLDYHRTWTPVNRRAALAAARGDPVLGDRLLALGGYDSTRDRVLSGTPLAAGNSAEIAALWAELVPAGDAMALTLELDRIFVDEGRANSVAVTDLAQLFGRLKRRGLALGIATNDSFAGAEATLAPFAVLEHVDFVAGYDSGHGTKPGPGPVHAFCQATGLVAAEVAVVGDNGHDLEMGRRAGVAVLIGVLTGNSLRHELEPLADHVLADISLLEQLLDALD